MFVSGWATTDDNGQKYDFQQFATQDEMLKESVPWQNDRQARINALAECHRLIAMLYTRLLGVDSEPPAFLRFDFMVKRFGTGKVRVMVGEMTEAGACPLFWKEGHELMFRALLSRWMEVHNYLIKND